MKLSSIQIEKLYEFTRQHFVEYYDLQTELADHLANAIEAESEKNPGLSFDQILHSEFKKFGVFGFMEIVESRQKALTKKYHKIVWRHFLEFFKLPKIAFILLAFAIVFNGLKYLEYSFEIYAGLFGIITFFMLGKFIAGSYQRSRKKPEKKRWLFEEIIAGYGSVAAFFILPIQLLSAFSRGSEAIGDNTFSLYLFTAFIIAYGVFCYIITITIPSKAKEYLAQTYPEYGLMQ